MTVGANGFGMFGVVNFNVVVGTVILIPPFLSGKSPEELFSDELSEWSGGATKWSISAKMFSILATSLLFKMLSVYAPTLFRKTILNIHN